MKQTAVTGTGGGAPTYQMMLKALLICGIAFVLLHVAVDILAAMRWEGCSYASQSVSELSAIGAPTGSLEVAKGIVYDLLLIAFAAGVWLSAGPKHSLRIAAILLAACGIVGLPGWFFSIVLWGPPGAWPPTPGT